MRSRSRIFATLPLQRRQWVLSLCAAGLPDAFAAPPPTGWVREPATPPRVRLTDAQGVARALPELVSARATAVQLIFTGCSATCPTQGLLFAALATRARVDGARWLSISIDALGDDAVALSRWQHKLGAHRSWEAAVPAVKDVEAVASYLRGVPASSNTHTAQVFAFDRAGRLRYRTGDNPEVAFVEALMQHVAGLG